MIKLLIYIAAVSLTVSSLVAQSGRPPAGPPPSRERPEVLTRQWQFKDTNGAAASNVDASVAYGIHNLRRSELNLVSQLDLHFHFVRRGHSYMFRRPNERDHRGLKPDEDLALYHVESGKYLHEAGRSTKPLYHWQLHHLQGANFALYNTRRKQYFVLITDGENPNTRAGFEKKPKQNPPNVWGI